MGRQRTDRLPLRDAIRPKLVPNAPRSYILLGMQTATCLVARHLARVFRAYLPVAVLPAPDHLSSMALASFSTAYAALVEITAAGESKAADLPAARDALKTAVNAVLVEASSDSAAAAAADALMVTHREKAEAGKYVAKPTGTLSPLLDPSILKGSLLASLKTCAHYPAILAMPDLCETIRKLVCSAPAKGVTTFLVDELGKDIETCTDVKALSAVHEVLRVHIQAEGRLKKELAGFVLGADHTKAVRTAANKAAKALTVAEAAAADVAGAAAKVAAAAAAKKKKEEFDALQKGIAAVAVTE